MKRYKAIFFDWDGTAVTSRSADASKVLQAMKPLLLHGVQLIIISGTTLENICGGQLAEKLTESALQNLSLGLARGNFDYGFTAAGKLQVLHDDTPEKKRLLHLHQICFVLHCRLLQQYGIRTDICFSRENYCKIDLTVDTQRTENLFLQSGDLERVESLLQSHGYLQGLVGLIQMAEAVGVEHGTVLRATTDAKFLEVGYTTKADNVDRFLAKLIALGIAPEDCCYWGDEFGAFGLGLWGSDAQMITPQSCGGDFFSVSTLSLPLPPKVQSIGGGCDAFLRFLREQAGEWA